MNSSTSDFGTMKILEDLVSIQSDTNSKLEIDVEKKILSYISSIEYFKENKTFGLEKIPQDHFERSIVWGLYKKNDNKETIIFLNHHDVVDDKDYGNLKSISRDNYKLKQAFSNLDFSKSIKEDLNSEDWFFGRGSADMKAGIAIQLNLLNELTKKSNKNILFISVPDEETLSTGMRQCSKFLKNLKIKHNLKYSLVINSEPHTRENFKNPTIYKGSVGKTMIAIFIKGKKCHIGEAFQGFNPALILSNIIVNTELNMNLSDSKNGECSPPPTWSFARDFKPCYDASIPDSAGGYLSFLTLSKTPKEILLSMKKICEEAFQNSINHYEKNFLIYNGHNVKNKYNVNVKLYEEFIKDLKNIHGNKIDEILTDSYKTVLKKIRDDEISVPESNFEILDSLCSYSSSEDPMVIIAISPPYYPHISSKNKEVFLKLNNLNSIFSETIEEKEFFMGISDLSYVDIEEFEDTAPYIKNNMPLWKEGLYTVPFNEMKELSIPVINIGPWGKDIHKLTERVFVPDITITTPKLIKELIHII